MAEAETRRRFHPHLAWLYLGISLAILPHTLRIPVWISLAFFVLISWRLFTDENGVYRFQASLIMQAIRLLLALALISGIMVTYGTLVGREAGVSLLILLTAMKFLEIRRWRDYYITAYLGLFLILTVFFYNQGIPMACYMLGVVMVFTASLITFNDSGSVLDLKPKLRIAGAILLQSLPLMLLIFILFPRIDGPLWGMPRDAYSGLSGLSGEMSPGSISQLILNDAIAFRVRFEGPVPEKSDLYWRGPVLAVTDGVVWTRDRSRRGDEPELSRTGDTVSYTLTLEPMDTNWLFALEMPVTIPEGVRTGNAMQLRVRNQGRKRQRFELTSALDYNLQEGNREVPERTLQLPYGYHSRTVALARSWRGQGLSDSQIIATALQMFNEEAFYYTLNPPRLHNDIIDEFLFETRQGFCEHYAAAFVVLMRAAGIPARVVTGYQGGNVNPLDNYLVVRQRDAHAWAEVWQENRGWRRIDPTSAVSPQRVSSGIETALPGTVAGAPLGLDGNSAAADLWRQLRHTIEAIDNRWNQWVLSYDARQQQRFFMRIGFGPLNWQGMLVTLLLLAGVSMLCLGLLLLSRRPRSTDRARYLYDWYCRRLARTGIRRRSNEGPEQFARRAARLRSDLAAHIESITRLYIQARYADQPEAIASLEQQIRSFRPRRSAPR